MKRHGAHIVLRLVVLLVATESSLVRGQGGNPPCVSIQWPDSGFHVSSGLYLKIKADAVSSNGSIARVQFLAQTNDLIGVVTNPPFNLVWSVGYGMTNLANDLVLTAVATDSLGLSTTSAPVTLYVYFGLPASPALNVTSPQDGAVFAAPATFLLSAELLASPGDTGPEEFFVGTNSVGVVNSNGNTDTFTLATPPFSVTMSNLAEGSYKLSVRYLGFDSLYCFCGSISIRVVKLAAISPRVGPDGRFQFDVVTSFPGSQTVIEVSPNLLNWTPVSTNQPSATTFTFTDPSPIAGSNRFYRVLVRPQ